MKVCWVSILSSCFYKTLTKEEKKLLAFLFLKIIKGLSRVISSKQSLQTSLFSNLDGYILKLIVIFSYCCLCKIIRALPSDDYENFINSPL